MTETQTSAAVERVARALAQRFIDRGNARVTGSVHPSWEAMPSSYRKDFIADAEAVLASLSPHDGVSKALDWFGEQHRLSLYFYSPVYGDDDDQSREWRVDRESGSINDREWDAVGRGETPAAAILAARTALGETK